MFTQEVRFSGDFTDGLDFMVGFYYFNSELGFQQNTNNVLQLPPGALGLPPGLPCGIAPGLRANPGVGDALCQVANARSIQRAGEDVKSIAVFGAINWRPAENLELSFGARYINEDKDAFNSYFDYSDGTFDTTPVTQEFNFAGRPERAGVAYEVSDS